MKRKFLEDMGLTKEQIDGILDENSQDIGTAKTGLTDAQAKLKEAEAEIAALKGQVSERDSQLEALKTSTGDIDSLKQQIVTLQSENKKKDEIHAAEIKKIQRESVDAELLTGAKAKNIKAVLGLLDSLDDSLDIAAYKAMRTEQIKTLQTAEDSKFLFDTTPIKFKGAHVGQGFDGIKGNDLSKMSYEELCSYVEENPE